MSLHVEQAEGPNKEKECATAESCWDGSQEMGSSLLHEGFCMDWMTTLHAVQVHYRLIADTQSFPFSVLTFSYTDCGIGQVSTTFSNFISSGGIDENEKGVYLDTVLPGTMLSV